MNTLLDGLLWLSTEIYPMSGSFHPYCVKSPDPNVVHRIFSTTQCLDAFCWCVLPSGEPVEGTLTKGEVECDDEGNGLVVTYMIW